VKTKPTNITGLLVTGAAFGGWCLGVSTNGVFNFFSDSPAFQLYPFCIALWILIPVFTTKFVVQNAWPPWSFMAASAICVTIFVGTSILVDRKEARSKPHLQMIVVTSPSLMLNDAIRLNTKEVLFPNGIGGTSNICACLLVPVRPPFTNATVTFGLLDDSDVPIDSMRTTIWFDEDLQCVPATGSPWHALWESWPVPSVPKMQSFYIGGSTMTLLPGEPTSCPVLNFPQKDSYTGRAFTVVIRNFAKGVPQFLVAFNLAFYHSTNSELPRLVVPKDVENVDGHPVYSIPEIKQ
jgi:hypothetical protein